MNLSPQFGRVSGLRPSQDGQLCGPARDGGWKEVPVKWLVDTGAEITTVRNIVGRDLQGESSGLTAGPTTGGGGIQVFSGLAAQFEVEEPAGTSVVEVEGYVGIKRGDTGSNVLGMHQLAKAGASISWDPSTGVGTLRGS